MAENKSGGRKQAMQSNTNTVQTPQSDFTTQMLAARLLDPWIAGDRRGLELEMSRWRGLAASAPAPIAQGDEGRGELLLCLVQQMMEEPDLWAPRSEKMHLGVWVDLLTHLAHPENPDPQP